MWRGLRRRPARRPASPTSGTRSRPTSASQGDYGIVEEYGGHGIGTEMHQDPHVLNYGRPGPRPEAAEGPGAGGRADAHPRQPAHPRARRRLDRRRPPTVGWSAHFEHTVARHRATARGCSRRSTAARERLAALGRRARRPRLPAVSGEPPTPTPAGRGRRPRRGRRPAARGARRGPADGRGVRRAAGRRVRGRAHGDLVPSPGPAQRLAGPPDRRRGRGRQRRTEPSGTCRRLGHLGGRDMAKK